MGPQSPERRKRIDMRQAFEELWQPGLATGEVEIHGAKLESSERADSARNDTSYACVIDRWGNAFSATPTF